MLPKDPPAHNQSTHFLKLRRVSTYNHPSHPHPSLQHSLNQDSPYFRTNSQLCSEVQSKKGCFISSLITKLKSVERLENPPFSSKEAHFKGKVAQGRLKAAQEMSNLINGNICNQERQGQDRPPQNSNATAPSHAEQSNIDKNSRVEELEVQNSILKEKMHELTMENEKLKLRLNKMDSNLVYKEERLAKREQEISKLQADLALREQLFGLDSAYSKQSAKKTQEELFSLSFSNIKAGRLSSCRQVNEVVLPVENAQLAKASQEVKQLRVEKLQLEKKFTVSLGQYRKKKEEEAERMKRSFTTTLTHYKDLMLKVSFRPSPEPRKYQEDTFETAILETSSADES